MSVKADQHFTIIPEWVLYAEVSATAVRLYGALRRYADKAGQAHPSRATLAEVIHVKSVRTIDAALDELEGIGAVHTEKRKEGRRYLSSMYTLFSAPPSAVSRTTPSATDRTTLVQQAAHELEPLNESHLEPEKVLRERNPQFDALAEIEGLNLQELDTGSSARLAVALAKIRKVTPDLTPGEIVRRAKNYGTHFPDATLTANALAKWWPRLGEPARNGHHEETTAERLARLERR